MSCDDLNGGGHGWDRLILLLVAACVAALIVGLALRMARLL